MSKGAVIIKLFKTLLIVVPCIIIAALVIVALPKKEIIVLDEAGDLEYYDEPTYVTNSEMSFFYKKDQLSTYREQKQPDKPTYFKMSENIVTTDFTKEQVSIVPDISKNYSGSRSLLLHEGQVKEFVSLKDNTYTLKGGQTVLAENSFEIILDHGILGHSTATPHRIERSNTYYAAFTSELETMYFSFVSANEFVSINIGDLSGRVEYTLLDSKMQPITNGVNNSNSNIEIQYKGKAAAKYYLKLTGSYSENIAPYSIKLSSDNNEWMWQMGYTDLNTEASNKFDYYGDEDYYVLPPLVLQNINKSVMRFTKADTDINVVVYDENKTVLGQYVYKPNETGIISLYGLENAYAIGIYSYNGDASGKEYAFVFEHTEITMLDIGTYGFELSPVFLETEDYYTARIKTLDDKMITDVMYSPPAASIKISVKQPGNSKIIAAELNKPLPLVSGRNIVTLSIELGGLKKDITIVISHLPETVSYTDFAYTETTMPESYREKIEALKTAHPNWKFTFVKTNVDFNSYVNSQVGKFSAQEVAYRVDPRNFFDSKNIFMFEKSTYNESINYSVAGIKGIWDNDEIAQYIMDAAKSTGLSPYFIAARAALESGRGTSKLATGSVAGYAGYYNFFGIGAYDLDPNNGGAAKAKAENWTSKRRALIEGAAWINEWYISNGQPTIYFMKFCFIPDYSWHQYMTDIAAPAKDANLKYSAYIAAGTLEDEKEFIIPVFNNMP